MCQFFQTRFSNAPQAAAAPESQHTKSGVTVEDVEKVCFIPEASQTLSATILSSSLYIKIIGINLTMFSVTALNTRFSVKISV
jgi:hypothetical protein